MSVVSQRHRFRLPYFMPDNIRLENYIKHKKEALIFCSQGNQNNQSFVKGQIIDVFSLRIASGFVFDKDGKLTLLSKPNVSEGRIWPIEEGVELINNERRPKRWLFLELNKNAWGIFFSGGGIQKCREILGNQWDSNEEGAVLEEQSIETIMQVFCEIEIPSDLSKRSQSQTLDNDLNTGIFQDTNESVNHQSTEKEGKATDNYHSNTFVKSKSGIWFPSKDEAKKWDAKVSRSAKRINQELYNYISKNDQFPQAIKDLIFEIGNKDSTEYYMSGLLEIAKWLFENTGESDGYMYFSYNDEWENCQNKDHCDDEYFEEDMEWLESSRASLN